jgi:hypothetical protein
VYLDPLDEPGEHLPHVSALLHGDDPEVILLSHPHQELNMHLMLPKILAIIMINNSGLFKGRKQ